MIFLTSLAAPDPLHLWNLRGRILGVMLDISVNLQVSGAPCQVSTAGDTKLLARSDHWTQHWTHKHARNVTFLAGSAGCVCPRRCTSNSGVHTLDTLPACAFADVVRECQDAAQPVAPLRSWPCDHLDCSSRRYSGLHNVDHLPRPRCRESRSPVVTTNSSAETGLMPLSCQPCGRGKRSGEGELGPCATFEL